jgi:hypothetical protein
MFVNYESAVAIDDRIPLGASVSVHVTSDTKGWVLDTASAREAVTKDLRANVFSQGTVAAPDVTADVNVGLYYRRKPNWWTLPCNFIWFFGVPLARDTCEVSVRLSMSQQYGGGRVSYSATHGDQRVVTLYRNLYALSLFPLTLKTAMEKLKLEMNSQAADITAALGGDRGPDVNATRDGVRAAALIPPRLSFDVAVQDGGGDGTFNGGDVVRLRVDVNNSGQGTAIGVDVVLSGSSKVLKHVGRRQSLGSVAPGQSKQALFEATLPYQVEADEGTIVVQVTEARGFGALEEKELTVAMQPAKVQRQTQVVSTLVDVDAPLDASGYIREDAYAVVVGISGYRSQSLPKVTYAKKDAEAVKDYLVGVCGFKEANIRLLVDDGASLSDLTAYCEEWLARNVRKGSFVFVYFAGHGTPSPDKGEAYIVPYDGEPGFVSKLYPLSRLYSSLAALPTDQVVVALDACFSGAGGRSVMEQGKRPLVAVDLEKEAQKLGNVAVLTASAGNEISQDYDAKRHGLFTYYLLKGLRGEADSDHDGWVTLGELHNYAKPKVADESQRLGYTQTLQLLSMGAATTARLAKLE